MTRMRTEHTLVEIKTHRSTIYLHSGDKEYVTRTDRLVRRGYDESPTVHNAKDDLISYLDNSRTWLEIDGGTRVPIMEIQRILAPETVTSESQAWQYEFEWVWHWCPLVWVFAGFGCWEYTRKVRMHLQEASK